MKSKLNPFERVLVEDKGSKAFGIIRNRYALDTYIKLPTNLQSPQMFFKDKNFGFDDVSNQKIYDLLVE